MDFETMPPPPPPPLSRRRVVRAFQMRGLVLEAAALDAVMNVLRREEVEEQEPVLDAILDELQNNDQIVIVTEQRLADVVADMSRNGTDVNEEALQLLDAFQTPRLTFDCMRKQFALVSPKGRDDNDKENSCSVFGTAKDKVEMFAQRFALVQQRILRQDLFRPKLVTSEGQRSSAASGDDSRHVTHALTPIESLLGRTGPSFLLGMIVQVEEGRYYLEDNTSQVPLDLSEMSVVTDGFITENCIVLVEGELVDGILRVHRMGNPIVETRSESIEAIGIQNTDLFSSMSTMAEVDKLREQEVTHGPHGMFVILSDVHLDQPHVLEKLDVLLGGYERMDPLPVFCLMGNFCSSSTDPRLVMGHYFDDLANLIAHSHPRLAEQGRFVLVPGPRDVGVADVLPRPPLSDHFARYLRSKVRHLHLSTNPCRIRYFSKELVLFRHDLVHQLRRHCIVKPQSSSSSSHHSDNEYDDLTKNTTTTNTRDVQQHAVKTILDQGHLCPLPLSACPIYWQMDAALRLYPLPDAVIVADSPRIDGYFETYAGCDVIHPGSFSRDFSFVVYRPVVVSVEKIIMEEEEDGDDDDDKNYTTTKSDVEFSQIPATSSAGGVVYY